MRSALNPVAQAGYNALVGPPAFSPAGTSRLGYVAAQGVAFDSWRDCRAAAERHGSRQHPVPRRTPPRVLDGSARLGRRLGKPPPLPWDFRPNARPEGGILGDLLRYGLGGVYDVPAQGPVHDIEQRKHIGAVAKAARKGH